MQKHDITWDQVRRGHTSEITVGTRWVNPGVGTAYRTAQDGSVAGVGWLPLDGTVWTAIALDGREVTAESHDGRTVTGSIRAGHILIVN